MVSRRGAELAEGREREEARGSRFGGPEQRTSDRINGIGVNVNGTGVRLPVSRMDSELSHENG